MSRKTKFLLDKVYANTKSYLDLPWHDPEPPPMLVRTLDQRMTPGNALDIGCGAGTYSLYMAGRGYAVTAIDFMPQAVEMTRRRAADAQYDIDVVEVDLRTWVTDKRFDVILDVGCLHSLAPRDRSVYRKQLLRWLAPGGDFVLTHWHSRGWWDRWPIGPRRVARRDVERFFAPELTLEDSMSDLRTGMPWLMGRSVLAVFFRLHRPASSSSSTVDDSPA
jgi:2-polyprenyl-3-methyl-5-hydroxy-6-metoxy-1,4-benzoquinol methylase